MIQIVKESLCKDTVVFYSSKEKELSSLSKEITASFSGKYLQTFWLIKEDGSRKLLLGMGEKKLKKLQIKELFASLVKECRGKKMEGVSVNIATLCETYGLTSILDIVEGLSLGKYEQQTFHTGKEKEKELLIGLTGIAENEMKEGEALLQEGLSIAEAVAFARDMVNLPGNKLRPEEFARQVTSFVEKVGIEAKVISRTELQEMGMEALLAVGDSSAYPPCMVVLRYMKNPESKDVMGLVGKGVTCDTGGYCLKPANSMLGIKGDMAGGAAVVGAMYAMAKNNIKTNAVAVIPMCENRISDGSLLPGDVIGSYAGKSIEIGNTDAEGRLILADAVAYAIKDQGVTRVLDIATLTGAVVSLLGFSIGGVLCDDDQLYEDFEQAFEDSGEQYLRIPFYDEHEKMIESNIADIRNIGESYCGTISAGLFIRAFTQNTPWIHLDIAGTAWVDSPVFEFQAKGATGAAVTTIYHLCTNKNMK